MRWLWILAGSACAYGELSWERRQNLTSIRASSGEVELQWLSSSTFRFQRCRPRTVCPSRADRGAAVAFTVTATETSLQFRTEYLLVSVSTGDLTVMVDSHRYGSLMRESPVIAGGRDLFERTLALAEELWGLGARTAPSLNLRGSTVATIRPLLLSSAGFGLYFAVPSSYEFDLGASHPDRLRVRAPFVERLEYFFYYGPTPKEILPEHRAVAGAIGPVSPVHVSVLPASGVPKFATTVPPIRPDDLVAYLNHAGMSAILAPAFDLAHFRNAAAQLMPIVFGPGHPSTRQRWSAYLYTYLVDARDRGLPLVRPLAMQFPNDAEARRSNACFMVGDELLVAPLQRCYLPMGIWTDLRTDRVYRGRQSIELPLDQGLPLLIHNGAILPQLTREGRMELHYFPRLGAEFFVSEAADDLPTQVHAAPAGEVLRLEIESRVAREYEWVVHHVSRPLRVDPARPFSYDPGKRQLRLRVQALADSDIILNVALEEPL
jgi:hypothetical protein